VRREDYKRPKRTCPYCKTEHTRLRRHLAVTHSQEVEVVAALALPAHKQQAAFDCIKKVGIFNYNKILMMEDADNCQLKRDHQAPLKAGNVSKKETKMCGQCYGFYSETYMWRHKLVCAKNSELDAESLPIPTVHTSMLKSSRDITYTTVFEKEVLRGLLHDDIGNLCRVDPTLLVFGQHEWRKNAKEDKKPVRNSMRLLAQLVLECRKIKYPSFTGADLFDRTKFETLTTALENATTGAEGEERHSRTLAIANTLKAASKTVMAMYMINDDLESAKEVERFRVVLDLEWAYLINRATHHVQMRSQELLRQPKRLPLEDDVKKIADYIQDNLHGLAEEENMSLYNFNRLRAMLVTRITLFNGRRGGECARMRLSDWEKSENKTWVDVERVTKMAPHEEALINTFQLAYISGKGKRIVPVLLPNDCLPAIRKLVSLRQQLEIHPSNLFLFPAGRHSKEHVPGNHAVTEICNAAKTSRPVTATEVRHSISTFYACQDLPEQERHRFYEHMGHSENINKDVYQAPLVFQEVTMVGKHLLNYDNQVRKKTGVHAEPECHSQVRRKRARTDPGATADDSCSPESGQYSVK
jgi:integrase